MYISNLISQLEQIRAVHGNYVQVKVSKNSKLFNITDDIKHIDKNTKPTKNIVVLSVE